MRKLSEKARKRWVRLSGQRERRNRRSVARRAELRRLGLTYQTASRPQPLKKKRFLVAAPKRLSLIGEPYEETVAFFETIRSVAFKEEHEVVFDLRQTEEITPELSVLLVAEIQRIKAMRGSSAVGGVSPENKSARVRLHSMGFFDALGMYDPKSLEEGDDTKPVYSIRTGTTLDGSVTKALTDDFSDVLGLSDDQQRSVQKAFNEALENISEHAYYDAEKVDWPAESGRWWICSVTSQARQGAFLFACDLGMTIPATVADTARKRGPENLAALGKYLADNFTKSEDERLLGAAFEEGVTRRPDGKGGRGLGKMVALAQQYPAGQLWVLSGGALAFMKRGQNVVQISKLPRRFSGTFVLWHLGMENAE